MLKKYLLPIITYLFLNIWLIVNWSFSKENVDPWNKTINDEYWYVWLWSIFDFFRDTIFSLILIITLSIFLYIWAKLIMARWKPEEFKNALMWFVYAVVWVVTMSFSRALIKFASWMSF
jgi:hypothetical protein